MNIITQNPFRVLGLTGNASERELQKQLAKIKAFERVGKDVSLDFDFNIIGSVSRRSEDIQEASNKIEQAQKKLLYSLFWFVNNTSFDDIAFNNLKENDYEKAIEIWNKTLKESISSRNYSSYLNLSTLYIALSTVSEQLDIQKLQAGIMLKGELLSSESIKDFSMLVTGSGISDDSIEISKKFVDELIFLLKPYINKKGGISIGDLITSLDSFPEEIQKYLSSRFTEVPISSIERDIDECIDLRNNSPRDANEYGENLYKKTKKNIKLLKTILGTKDLQFQMIANKLANEILQCSIDFFNTIREENNGIDPGDKAYKLAKYAKSIGATGQVKGRIKESLDFIEQWVADKPKRDRDAVVAKDIKDLIQKLNSFANYSDSISNAKYLVTTCKKNLENIKSKLGTYDENYLNLSSAVANNSLSMVIEVVNEAQSSFAINHSMYSLKSTISEAVSAVNEIGQLDMNNEVRSRFTTNKQTINSINNQVNAASARTTTSSSSGGCYIATMAYGDYDHPQVKVLRRYRDESLAKSSWGRAFIRFYYATSPHLVRLLKDQSYINKQIRNLLDKLVNKVK